MGTKLGIQLYTLREQCKTYEDCDNTFDFITKLGTNVVQFSGLGDFPIEKKQELVQKYNLDVCVTHDDFKRMLSFLPDMIKEHKMLGCDTMGIGSMPFDLRMKGLDGIKEFIEKCNIISKELKENGMKLAYHNHSFEFEKLDGEKTVMDMIIDGTNEESFIFIPDCYWLQYAGINPFAFIEKLKNRIKVVHFKDMQFVDDCQEFAEIGTGNMDYDGLYALCAKLKIPYIVYEQDTNFRVNAFESTKESYVNLVKIQERAK